MECRKALRLCINCEKIVGNITIKTWELLHEHLILYYTTCSAKMVEDRSYENHKILYQTNFTKHYVTKY